MTLRTLVSNLEKARALGSSAAGLVAYRDPETVLAWLQRGFDASQLVHGGVGLPRGDDDEAGAHFVPDARHGIRRVDALDRDLRAVGTARGQVVDLIVEIERASR